jgi:outer membrane protein OmpA-like peptidoglycan-associated protein
MRRERNNFNIWPTFTDIMMGMVFLLLLVAMAFIVDQKDKIISEKISELKMELANSILEGVDEQRAAVKYADSNSQTNEILVRFKSDSLFDEGQYALKHDYQQILVQVAKVLERDPTYHEIIVEGHTDDQPYHSSRGNWGLSADRAISVVKLFQESTSISLNILSPRGYADTQHPDTSSLSESDRALWIEFTDFMSEGPLWKKRRSGEWWDQLSEDQRELISMGSKLMRRVDIRIKYNPDSIWYDISGQKQQ